MDNPVRKSVQLDPRMLAIIRQIGQTSGLDPDQVIHLALFDLGRRMGLIKVTPVSMAPPSGVDLLDEAEPEPPPAARPGRPSVAPQLAPAPVARPASRPAARPGGGDLLLLQVDDGPLISVRKDIFLIGRGSKCDHVIQHRSVSREHAVVTRERNGWFIEDLNSANGTWLDGEQITKHRLSQGDEILISNHRLRFTVRAS
ncbi:MAG TPA: FHA domain-containing protein [Myxococcota bacterium]|nr:FHA domain-containing protein [Myxococcota bacterium]HRY95087.1 FHA domain-containing protein [Myxococcota bacterium]HSA23047.1 FHA domain-containing protein [Myxococcota bacterium]